MYQNINSQNKLKADYENQRKDISSIKENSNIAKVRMSHRDSRKDSLTSVTQLNS